MFTIEHTHANSFQNLGRIFAIHHIAPCHWVDRMLPPKTQITLKNILICPTKKPYKGHRGLPFIDLGVKIIEHARRSSKWLKWM